MKSILYLALLAFVSTLASPALAAGKTAKALLPLAVAEATKWQPDAALVNLETKGAEPDGTVSVKPLPGLWSFTFMSPKTKKKILVTVDGKGEVTRLDSGYYKNVVVGEFTVDSDRAMAEAVKNGLKTNKFGMSMSLENREGRAQWQMLDDKHFYYVDANTGKFLREEKTD